MPSLTLSPYPITVNTSERIDLTCTTGLCNPEAAIRWFKGGEDITSKSVIEIKSAAGSNSFLRTTSILQYTAVKADNGAQLYCEATNQIGPSVKSEVYTLNVKCKHLLLHCINLLLILRLPGGKESFTDYFVWCLLLPSSKTFVKFIFSEPLSQF